MTSEIECQVVVILIVIAPMAMLPDGMGLSLVQYKMDFSSLTSTLAVIT